MNIKYILQTDIVTDEEQQQHIVYGITAIDGRGNALKTFSDIFFDKDQAKNFVELCNTEKLELIHLANVIEDMFT